MYRFILASASPRRRELLQRIVPEFEIIPAQGEERSDAADPREYVRELASHKAREVMARVLTGQNTADRTDCVSAGSMQNDQAETAEEPLCVIGSDTIVVCDEEIMGKPFDREDAERMIHRLQGRSHEVMTGVCVLHMTADAATGTMGDPVRRVEADSFTCVTRVHVAPMTDAEIRYYLATGEADDKAGAYGIQGAFSLYVTGIDGSYSNVVGLPVAALYQRLRTIGAIPF